MKIRFQTKEESNQQQQKAFLQLQPAERVLVFYRMMERLKNFPTKKVTKNNFTILINE